MKAFTGCVAAAALCLTASVAAAAGPEVKPGKDFQGLGFSITSTGNVVVYAGVREVGGKVAVCGLVFFEKATSTTKAIEPQFTEKISFTIAGKELRPNSRSFNRFKTEEEAFAGNARCSVTTTVWDDAYGKAKLSMKLGSVTVYN